MQAIIQTGYGDSSVLQLKEIEAPIPADKEVLVRVRAVSINDYDWCLMRGRPYIYRLMFGLFKPKNRIPGMEIAGEVVALGKSASRYSTGDAVFGDISNSGFGGFAEYVCVDEASLTRIPVGIRFEEAASIPHAGALAQQGLVDIGGIQQSESVLINGAGGGVGTLGLQIAKCYRAEVTGVDTGDKLQTMKAIGFDQVVDYQQEDFTNQPHTYDLILDTKTNRSPLRYLKVLSPGGRYVTVGGSLIRILQLLLLRPWISRLTDKRIEIVSLKVNKDLDVISRLYTSGKLAPVIDSKEGLEAVPTAIEYFGTGKHTGKVVISLGHVKSES